MSGISSIVKVICPSQPILSAPNWCPQRSRARSYLPAARVSPNVGNTKNQHQTPTCQQQSAPQAYESSGSPSSFLSPGHPKDHQFQYSSCLVTNQFRYSDEPFLVLHCLRPFSPPWMQLASPGMEAHLWPWASERCRARAGAWAICDHLGIACDGHFF